MKQFAALVFLLGWTIQPARADILQLNVDIGRVWSRTGPNSAPIDTLTNQSFSVSYIVDTTVSSTSSINVTGRNAAFTNFASGLPPLPTPFTNDVLASFSSMSGGAAYPDRYEYTDEESTFPGLFTAVYSRSYFRSGIFEYLLDIGISLPDPNQTQDPEFFTSTDLKDFLLSRIGQPFEYVEQAINDDTDVRQGYIGSGTLVSVTDIIPVSEPGTWFMLAFGVCVFRGISSSDRQHGLRREIRNQAIAQYV